MKNNDKHCDNFEIGGKNKNSCENIEENFSSDGSLTVNFFDTGKENDNTFSIEKEEVAMKFSAKSLLVLSPAGTGSTLLCIGIAFKVRGLW